MGSSVDRGGSAEGVEVAEDEAVQAARVSDPAPPPATADERGASGSSAGGEEEGREEVLRRVTLGEEWSSAVSSDSDEGSPALPAGAQAEAVGDESVRRSQLLMHRASLVRRSSNLMAETTAASPVRAASPGGGDGGGEGGIPSADTPHSEGGADRAGTGGAGRGVSRGWASARKAMTTPGGQGEASPSKRIHSLWLQVLGMALSGSRFAQSLRSVRARREVGMNSAGDGLAAAKAIGEDEEGASGRSVNRGCWVCDRWCEAEFRVRQPAPARRLSPTLTPFLGGRRLRGQYTPGSSGPPGSEVSLHLDIENFNASPMERVEAGAAVLRRMVPPGRIYYHFSVGGKAVVARDQPRHFRVTELNFVDAPQDTERGG